MSIRLEPYRNKASALVNERIQFVLNNTFYLIQNPGIIL